MLALVGLARRHSHRGGLFLAELVHRCRAIATFQAKLIVLLASSAVLHPSAGSKSINGRFLIIERRLRAFLDDYRLFLVGRHLLLLQA